MEGMKVITFRLPTRDLRLLKEIAEKKRCSVSDVVRSAILGKLEDSE